MKRTSMITALALFSLLTASGCIIESERDTDTRHVTTTKTTTTTTTVHEPVYEPVAYVPEFVPAMSSITAELLVEDHSWGSSWQYYTMNFSDVADSYMCDEDMSQTSPGSVVTLRLNGYEVSDEYAACPEGVYNIAADCDLYEGEACLDIVWRDTDGFEAGSDYATGGYVEVTAELGYHGEPNRCNVYTSTNGHSDMSFEYSMFFESFDLSPQDHHSGTICTL